jgi:hypothetical protein
MIKVTSSYQICEHKKFQVKADVNRLEDSGQFQLDVKVICMQCLKPFEFIGLPVGLNLNGAAISFDGTEARLAIKPKEFPP